MTDTSNGSVRKISATSVTTLATGFSNPFGIVVDGSGTVYVADSGNHAIKKITSGALREERLSLYA